MLHHIYLCNCSLQVKSISVGGLANFLNNFVCKKDPTSEEGANPRTIYDDVNMYLRMPQIPVQDSAGHDQDILAWWRDQQTHMPNLAKMARQFLASPASSACSERLFSAAGKMHDDLKKSTSEETLESSLIVGHNYPNA